MPLVQSDINNQTTTPTQTDPKTAKKMHDIQEHPRTGQSVSLKQNGYTIEELHENDGNGSWAYQVKGVDPSVLYFIKRESTNEGRLVSFKSKTDVSPTSILGVAVWSEGGGDLVGQIPTPTTQERDAMRTKTDHVTGSRTNMKGNTNRVEPTNKRSA